MLTYEQYVALGDALKTANNLMAHAIMDRKFPPKSSRTAKQCVKACNNMMQIKDAYEELFYIDFPEQFGTHIFYGETLAEITHRKMMKLQRDVQETQGGVPLKDFMKRWENQYKPTPVLQPQPSPVKIKEKGEVLPP